MGAPTFHECVYACLDNPEFMAQYRRLTGSSLGLKPSPLQAMIDRAASAPAVDAKEALAFFEFVRTAVYAPLAGEVPR